MGIWQGLCCLRRLRCGATQLAAGSEDAADDDARPGLVVLADFFLFSHLKKKKELVLQRLFGRGCEPFHCFPFMSTGHGLTSVSVLRICGRWRFGRGRAGLDA